MSRGAIRTYVPVNQMDKVTSNILNDLLYSNKTEKEIANSNKVELAVVKRVKQRFNKEILEKKAKQKQADTVVINMKTKETIEPTVVSISNKSKKLSDNDILEILYLITDSTLTYTEIAKKFNVSSKRIQQLAAEYDVQRKPKRKPATKKVESKKTQKKEVKKETNNKDTLIKVEKSIVEAGLIIDRHPMPVGKYIFKDDIDSKLMFNYEAMENIVDEFITNNITFNEDGISNEVLTVFVSGLQCALASLFKVCHNRKVNLTIMHYNAESKKYIKQVVINYNNINIEQNKFANISKDTKEMYLYNCKYEDIINNDFYALYMYSNNNIKTLVLFKSFEDIWQVYPDYVKFINDNTNSRLHLILTSAVLEDDRIKWKDVISKSYNYTDYK